MNIESLAKHYIEACTWADSPEGTRPRATKQARGVALKMCREFANRAEKQIGTLKQFPAYWAHPDCAGKMEAALGHDLWLTSAGHGAGFFDRDTLPATLREKLTDLAGKAPEPEFYRGRLYLHGGGV